MDRSDLSRENHRTHRLARFAAIAAWAAVAFIVYATLVPLSARPHLADNPNGERFLAYAVAGALLALAYPRHAVRIALLTAALAVGLEVLQRYAVDRHPGLVDVAFKALGGIVGVACARGCYWVFGRRRS